MILSAVSDNHYQRCCCFRMFHDDAEKNSHLWKKCRWFHLPLWQDRSSWPGTKRRCPLYLQNRRVWLVSALWCASLWWVLDDLASKYSRETLLSNIIAIAVLWMIVLCRKNGMLCVRWLNRYVLHQGGGGRGDQCSAAKFSAPVERSDGTFIVIGDTPMVNGERFHLLWILRHNLWDRDSIYLRW